jgi:hypothetical protein
VAVVIVTVLSLSIDFALPRRWLGIGYWQLARAGGWALVPASVAAAGMLAVSALFPFPPLAQVVVSGLSGCALFALTAWIFQRNLLGSALRELGEKMGWGR